MKKFHRYCAPASDAVWIVRAARAVDDSKSQANSAAAWRYGCYVPLLIPITLFLVSLYIPPRIDPDAGVGFLVLHSMMQGGPFNSMTMPDPANIANDTVTFLTWYTPGQYLVPGSFIWLGTDYGLALSLTALIVTLIGVAGWIQVARSFAVSSYVLSVFVLGLSSFSYVLSAFRAYNGGEMLLFAAAPWSLYAMRWAVSKPAALSFTISLLSVALLFFTKLTGLIVFATNVIATSLCSLVSQRRLSPPIFTMWVASAIGALCFMMFWLARGAVPASVSTFAFTWFPIWFAITGVAFSGISVKELLFWFLGHPWVRIISEPWEFELLYYVLGPLGLLLMVWVWRRLRHTRYRDMAILLLTIILLYAITITTMYLWQGSVDQPVSFEDRHFRYAGILFFLLLLTAIDQWRVRLANTLACAVVIVLGLYGLKSYVMGAYAQMRAGYYDPVAGIFQDIGSPAILEYMRSEVIQHNYKRPIAAVPMSPSVAVSLPRFRMIYTSDPTAPKYAGRSDKIFVVVQKEMIANGKSEAILRSFTDYEFESWRRTNLDGMVIYTQ
jgi:hypothetical protein